MDYVCLWADGIHLGVRLDEENLCLLVMIGVQVDGTKEFIALTEGYRESTGSWADLLRDCKRRVIRAPVLVVGDGALGFWSALREVFPDTREQRCWFHKIGNVLVALPKSAHPGAKRALAEDGEHARRAVAAFKLAYGAVIWSPSAAVFHVRHGAGRAWDLLAGRGYLPRSNTQIFRRIYACSAGRLARFERGKLVERAGPVSTAAA